MTIAVMRSLGVEVLSADGRRFVVAAGQRYGGGDYEVEPDASAATYFWAAAAVTGGGVRVVGLGRGSLQGDVGFADVLGRMGCTVAAGDDWLEVRGPREGELRGVEVDLNSMPDTVQTLAVTALAAAGPTTIRNVGNLRIKETDRLAALARELAKLGAAVEERADGLTIRGYRRRRSRPTGTTAWP
jgi:3-phosphoshikimate 1-carboxyvinyltransferase